MNLAAFSLALSWLAAGVQADDELARIDERFGTPQVQEDPSFQRHVLPLMGRLGCNGRACHGSFQGQGGFQLSLFGYDFETDHQALTGGDSPRVDLENPADSLILVKPTDEDEHEGGKRYEKDGWEYRVLSRWISSGAKDDSREAAELERLEVIPADITFHDDGQKVQLRAIAHWTDGSREDVTPICRFQSNDKAVAEISEAGLVESTGKGDTHVVVFYDNGITPVPVLRPISAELARKYPRVPTPTKVDELTVAKLRKLGVVPSDVCSDAEFLRRAALDITGTLPRPEEVVAFLNDTSADKRSAKVDELLARPEYAAWWATKFSDFTGNSAQNVANNGFRNEEARQWYEWLYDRIERNEPYDKLVAGMVEATGRNEGETFEDFCREMGKYYRSKDPAHFGERETMPHFWSRRDLRTPENKALSFSYAFLGVRLECAQCHKHPFDQWSKHDFEKFKAFFSAVQYGTPTEDAPAFREMNEKLGLQGRNANQMRGQVAGLLNEGKVVPFREVYVAFRAAPVGRRAPAAAQRRAGNLIAALLGGETIEFAAGEDPRATLMEWMRRDDNPYFARALVNRVWANYFNVGIIEPPDDLNLANPPSNAALLDWLTQQFIAQGYDMKWLHRTIATSRTYQLSWMANESNRLDTRNFSHAVPRRMPAEVLYDALRQATASDEELASAFQIESRAIGPMTATQDRGVGGAMYALRTFGKPQRTANCDCERSMEPSLLQTLYLQNDAEMFTLIDRGSGWLRQVAREHRLAVNPAGQGADRSALMNRYGPEMARLARRIEQARRDGDRRTIARLQDARRRLVARIQAEQEGDDAAKAEANAADAAAEKAQAKNDRPPHPAVEAAGQRWIEEAYLRTLSRLPSESELARGEQHLREAEDPVSGLRDIVWALLNTKEFIVNH